QVYGQGSALDCRHHVQKLNLLQGEAEEAIGRASRCVEDSVSDGKNTAAQREDSSVQQEGKAEISRWSKYLDKDSEEQEDGEEEEAVTERQQFCSLRRNAVQEQRKQQKSFISSDVQEYAEENGVFQLAYQAKKRRKCLAAEPDGDALSGDRTVPAVSESIVPREKSQTSTASTKPSKWEKFLPCSDSFSAARAAPSPQEGSGGLGLHGTAAVDAGRAGRSSEQAGRALPTHSSFKFRRCVAPTEQLALEVPGSTVPSTSCSVEDAKAPQSHLVKVGSGILERTAGRCCLDSTRQASTLGNSNAWPKPSTVSCEHLFCTGEEFDDDL
ncbi:MRNIP protein, partial [Atlantisia rogersi]|nr:MRNIP protein [Atlantisia rogersi]